MSDTVLFVSTHELREMLRLRVSPRSVQRYARALGLPRVRGLWALTPEALTRAVAAATAAGGVRARAPGSGPASLAGRKKITNKEVQVVDLKGKDGGEVVAGNYPAVPRPPSQGIGESGIRLVRVEDE